MKLQKLALIVVFADFAALTAYALVTEPPAAIVEALTANWWSTQLAFDLIIALTFGAAWLWRDAKARGLNPLPWVIAMPLTGSLALLVYALRCPTEPVGAPRGAALA